MERMDVIAWLLAARHDPEIKFMPEYAEARMRVDADPELAAAYEAERAYYDGHENYLDFIRLPDGVRERIKRQLRAASDEAPLAAGRRVVFPWRPVAIAASLAVLAAFGWRVTHPGSAGPVVAQASVLNFDGFLQFAASKVKSGFSVDYTADDTPSLIAWLGKKGAPQAELAEGSKLAALPTVGCKILEWEGQPVSLLCFKVGDDVVHLFVTPASCLPPGEHRCAASCKVYADRATVGWSDGTNIYVLIAHKPGQALSWFSG